METFAERLANLREMLGIRQNKFAEKLGVTPSHVGKILKGAPPSPLLLTAISCVFRVERHWLETGQGRLWADEHYLSGKNIKGAPAVAEQERLAALNEEIAGLRRENAALLRRLQAAQPERVGEPEPARVAEPDERTGRKP